MTRRIGVLGRFFVMALALEVADVPIVCAEERPGPQIASWPASIHAPALGSSSQGVPLGVSAGVPRAAGCGADVSCFCPCHLNFDAPRESDLARLGPTSDTPRPTASFSASSRPGAIEHPPQNLL